MSFVGDLEHLPIVDVIQLLHATRKSGTLCLKSDKGESQLVFSDGCIVSANHSNNSVRIGQILVQMNAITREELEQTLLEQKSAGNNRAPLIASLIESGKIRKEDAFKGLETLIEMTIVEVLTWTEGTFELDVESCVVSDEYRYIPEKLKLDLHLNTQNVLMDALRIYDEKKRDGTLMTETFPAEESIPPPASSPSVEEQIISIDDLGLDVLDDLEKVIPGFFTPVKVHDPAAIHREKIGAHISRLPADDQEKLLSYLVSQAEKGGGNELHGGSHHALILFSGNDYISHMVVTACKHDGLFTFSTDEEENLDHIINQSIAKELTPVLVIDPPEDISEAAAGEIVGRLARHVMEKFPTAAIFQLVQPQTYDLALCGIRSGVRSVFPKPDLRQRMASFVQDSIAFLETLKQAVRVPQPNGGKVDLTSFKESLEELSGLKELGEITAVLERFTASMFSRVVTLTVRKTELVGERLQTASETRPLSLSIRSDASTLLQQLLTEGKTYFGPLDDQVLEEAMGTAIPLPASRQVMLLPLRCLGRVLAITYADFGDKPQSAANVELCEILARHAGLVYENSLYRKKFEQMIQQQH